MKIQTPNSVGSLSSVTEPLNLNEIPTIESGAEQGGTIVIINVCIPRRV